MLVDARGCSWISWTNSLTAPCTPHPPPRTSALLPFELLPPPTHNGVSICSASSPWAHTVTTSAFSNVAQVYDANFYVDRCYGHAMLCHNTVVFAQPTHSYSRPKRFRKCDPNLIFVWVWKPTVGSQQNLEEGGGGRERWKNVNVEERGRTWKRFGPRKNQQQSYNEERWRRPCRPPPRPSFNSGCISGLSPSAPSHKPPHAIFCFSSSMLQLYIERAVTP